VRIAYIGKAKNITLKEIWLFWRFGRKIELLEDVDFCKN